MKSVKIIAIVLIVFGFFILAYRSIKLIKPDKVISADSIEISKEQNEPINWAPYTGLFFICVGGSLLMFTRKKPPLPPQ